MTGASIQLFAVGSTGEGSASTNLLTNSLTTDRGGGFSLAGDYTCPATSQQVYLVATGGSPVPGESPNLALAFVSALGNCGDLQAGTPGLIVNELTTVAAGYALAPFMQAWDHVGASSTNQVGLRNAFLNAHLLADMSTGTLAANASTLTVESAKMNTLANALASCATSSGGSACAPLFTAATPSGGAGSSSSSQPVPTDTLTALLDIVRNPGNHVQAVFDTQTASPPYTPTLLAAPHDWTMSLTVTGGGLFEPTALAIDKLGNVWVTNFGGPTSEGTGNPPGVVAYSPQGTPFPGTPFSDGQTEAYGLTVDTNGDVWVTSEENISHGATTGSVAKLLGATSGTPGTVVDTFSDPTLYFPESIAADTTQNTILIGNYASGTATIYDLNGKFLRNVAAGYSSYTIGVAPDGAGGLWLANEGAGNVTHVAADGTARNTTCCDGPGALAVDPQANVWVANTLPNGNSFTFSEVSGTGALRIAEATAAGLDTPGGVAVDAGGQFWLTNYYDASFSEIAGNQAAVAPGTGISPFAFGKDAGLLQPFAIAPDASGNLWISNRVRNSLVMFFGLATPTATPAAPLPTAP